MKKKIKHPQGMAEVNMTPMLDIVFILLIFFIVTASFEREQGLDVSKHNNEEPEPQKSATPVVIKVCANQDILFDRRGIDMRSVRANVEQKLAEFGNISVVVETEPEAPTGLLVKVMDQAIAVKAGVSIAPAKERCNETKGLQVLI